MYAAKVPSHIPPEHYCNADDDRLEKAESGCESGLPVRFTVGD